MFFRKVLFLSFLFSAKESKNSIHFLVQFPLIYMRGSNFSSYFSFVIMILPVIITFSFYGGFLLSSVVLPFLWDGPPNFWLWVDRWYHCGSNILFVIIQAEVVTHSARPSYLSFEGFDVWMRDLYLPRVRSLPDVDIAYDLLSQGPLAWAPWT